MVSSVSFVTMLKRTGLLALVLVAVAQAAQDTTKQSPPPSNQIPDGQRIATPPEGGHIPSPPPIPDHIIAHYNQLMHQFRGLPILLQHHLLCQLFCTPRFPPGMGPPGMMPGMVPPPMLQGPTGPQMPPAGEVANVPAAAPAPPVPAASQSTQPQDPSHTQPPAKPSPPH